VSITSGNNLFAVNVSLSQSGETYHALHSLGNEKTKIPIAFGYREEAPNIAPTEKKVKVIEAKPDNSLVGSIKDTSGQMVFYHDADTKKIFTKGSHDSQKYGEKNRVFAIRRFYRAFVFFLQNGGIRVQSNKH
jgi:hypothetical protein